jgi:PAS domain S-box-containing protein
MFGYSRDEILGNSVTVLIPSRFREAHSAKQAGFFLNPHTRVFNESDGVRGLRKDGTEIALTALLKPLQIESRVLAMAILRRY